MKNNKLINYCFFTLLLSCTFACNCDKDAPSSLKLWYEQPATQWMQATPIGNGRLGAMIYGGVNTETIALNEITLWSGQYDEHQEQACGKERLAKIRQLFFAGNIEAGNNLGTQYLSGSPHSFGTHLPMGDLKLQFGHAPEKITHYKRELNLENAVTTVTYRAGSTRYSREYICSNPDDVLLIKLAADGKDALNVTLGLDLLLPSDLSVSNNTLSFSGQALFKKQGPGGVHFIGNIHVSVTDGEIKTENNTLSIANAHEALITVDLRTDYKNPRYIERCNQTIQQATEKTYAALKEAHIADYTRLFNRTQLYLGNSDADKLPTDVRWRQLKAIGNDDPGLISLFFQYGRYLLIASSRENTPLPANLQGVWNDNLACNMGWTCDYHLDINTQQNYWLSNIGNLPECNAPLFTYLEDLSEHGEKTAKTVYGSPGWVAHTVANVWGYTAPGQSVNWGLTPSSGAWLATHLWTHYEFTQDKAFLQAQAYPILKKAAVFFLDYIALDPRNGYLMTGPSISPENSFKVAGREWCMSLTPTIDRIMVYEIFNACIQASGILEIDADFRESLETAIAKLPPLQIATNGTVQEWFEDYELAHPEHRHSSHLLSLYPFHQISLEKTPELAEAADKSIHRQINAEHYEDVEWSRANVICFYARLKKPEEAYKNIKGLLQEFSRENLFTMAPAGVAGANEDIFEFDANEAAPAGIAEMLLQSHEGYIELLPALPTAWKDGHFKGLCVRGGAIVDAAWKNGRVTHASITATVDHTFHIKHPSKNDVVTIALKKGESFELN
ncbi:MAG: glycoside hydrolase family 95 protein [Dysgonamonadaceae bacterium]|jgi:alpha-L-fucosidase 2|nr:glycoside hydrolase family 95 protein [Dysgonamonadaceae bacterium]